MGENETGVVVAEQPEEATQEKGLVKRAQPTLTVGKITGGIVPRNIDDLWRMAKLMALSGMMPKNCTKAESVAVAVQMGLEVGLAPMQAVQNIAVINGRPSIWGDAALGLVEASGLLEDFQEECLKDPKSGKCVGYRCRAKRVGRRAVIEHEFTESDAKQAKLLDKEGPWQTYPKRMYQMRARSWTLRDGFADVLKGLRLAEEEMDVIETEIHSISRNGTDVLAPGRHALKPATPPESSATEPEDPKTEPPAPEEPKAKKQPAFDRQKALDEIDAYVGGQETFDAFDAACKAVGIKDPDTWADADDGQLDALLSKVCDLTAE